MKRHALSAQSATIETLLAIVSGSRSKPRAGELELLAEQARQASRSLLWLDRNMSKIQNACGSIVGGGE